MLLQRWESEAHHVFDLILEPALDIDYLLYLYLRWGGPILKGFLGKVPPP